MGKKIYFQYTPPTKTAWDNLPMSGKADIIKSCVRNGITNLQDIRTTYNNYASGRNILEGIPDYTKKAAEFGNFLAGGGIITYGKPYYSYDKNGNKVDDTLNYNATLPEVVITPDSKLSPAERNYRERQRQQNLPDYAENKNKEWTDLQTLHTQREWENSPQKRALDLAMTATEGIGIGTDIVATAMGGIPVYSGLRGAQALDEAIHNKEVADYVDAALWLSPMLTVAGKKVYDAAKPAVQNVFKKGTPAAEWATFSSKNFNSLNSSSFGEKSPVKEDFIKIGSSLAKAEEYKRSEGYRALTRRAGEESKAMGTGFFPEETFTTVNEEWPLITFSKRPKNNAGGYNELTNTIDLDLEQSAGLEVPFHEGLHWQGVGSPNIKIGPKYEAYQKALASNQPNEEISKLLTEFRKSPERKRLEYRNNAITYLRNKVDKALIDDYPVHGYLKAPEELQATGTETGRALGIKPFSSFPGYEKAKTFVEPARKYNTNMKHIKAETPEEVETFWQIITGNYIPSVIGGGVFLGSNIGE